MTRFDAHAAFCIRPDGGHGLLPPDADHEVAPAFCTALASLSGMLDGCETQADLDEAVSYGFALLSMETVGQPELHEEIVAVFAEVGEWADAAEADLNRIAESN